VNDGSRYSREVGGPDALDTEVDRRQLPQGLPREESRRAPVSRGLAPAWAPVGLFVVFGMVLGPAGLNVLTTAVLTHLSPVVSVGLAALGVFVGLGLGLRTRFDRRLLYAANVESVTTIVVVAAGLALATLVASRWLDPLDSLIVGTLAIAAAASAAGHGDPSRRSVHEPAVRISEFEDVVPIALGGVLLALAREPQIVTAIGVLALTALVSVAVAAAGWLLLKEQAEGGERIAFVAGALLLLGGGAQYLGVSALLSGMIAGMFWARAPGEEILRGVLSRIQHPVVILMLLVAGASLELSWPIILLTVAFVALRFAGKLAGGWGAARLAPLPLPPGLGLSLTAPGVIGIAFAVNVGHVAHPVAGTVALAVVALGSIASELLAFAVAPRQGVRR
jgi:hypothetical protein